MLQFLIEKEFKQIRRNRFLPRLIFVLPFGVLLIMPLAANFEVKKVTLCIVDNNHSSLSQRLINKITSSQYFRLTAVSHDYTKALRNVELDKADLVLEIPIGFEHDLITERKSTVLISANTVNGTRGGLGSAFLSSTILDFANQVNKENTQLNSTHAMLTIIPQFRYNPYLRYPIFMVPALMVMLMTMICGFLPALNIVNEKESGTIEQINVTPVKRFNFILSKLIPYWIIGFVVLSVCFGVARLFYGLIPAGNILTIYLFASIFVLAFSGFGLVISNFAKSIQQAMFTMFFFVMTFVLMSGLYTPVNSMPHWAQIFSMFSPLKYFIQVMRLVYLKGSSFHELHVQFLALVGFALFFNGLAVITYRKKSN